MSAAVYLDQENSTYSGAGVKPLSRIPSHPGEAFSRKGSKTPKVNHGLSLPSRHNSVGTPLKIISDVRKVKAPVAGPRPAVHGKVLEPCKEEYPEIEKMFPYCPEEFEEHGVVDVLYLSRLPLAGLPAVSWDGVPVEDDIALDRCRSPRPDRMSLADFTEEIELILQAVDFPPEEDFV
ncbi:securin [Denticeps clupeoides]|uniref:securin n=1 Tax=Denticeps clupeoides TaxID=299321 RepID=UPI0010A334EC|nr:securin-like [Denticeps clupeoides]XP_028840481.1 securin-like [Denticeps clupeoides]XP_028840482.1 securin-like [Denticeps clupeoides]